MKILLDTCTFLWLASGDDRLSSTVKNLVTLQENKVLLSTISAWEVVIKYKSKKLHLPSEPNIFIKEAMEQLSLEVLDLKLEHVLRLSYLPTIHKDPFDRALSAQCIEEQITILTPDPIIAQYGARTMW